MGKNQTVLIICGLLLVADWLCIDRTLDDWDLSDLSGSVRLLAAEITAGAAILWIGLVMARRAGFRLSPGSGDRIAIRIPGALRRLFVSVWS